MLKIYDYITRFDQDINDLDALFEEEDDNMMIDMMAEEDKQQVSCILCSCFLL